MRSVAASTSGQRDWQEEALLDYIQLVPAALERVASDPAADAVYQRLLRMLEDIGSFTIEPGKASFLVRNGVAFLGVHPRRGALRINIVLKRALTSKRVDKSEQVSRGRFHNEVLLKVPDDLDGEFAGWVAEARALTQVG